ncbi:uncharacterized protein LOC103945953 isoform X4 [Pyrus x bretschneideri]|uniref:uncharacterized protein LOC103945953 isoform X4 n=1 Tax=Pyrus x bretschneideri TaxID=225117 RepID=UPI00203054E6|nr:uncharacterized protein LOC103945953 isoform X4 [Pyrus x bretschneideri]
MDPDVDVSRWVIELLLRDREKDCIAKRLLAVAPFSDQDFRLKKTVLLRTIECEVYEASVSETILETLEMIEDLDIREGIATTESMKAAYCSVATECTVKFLVGFMGKPSGKYLEAVDRIWRGRVGVLERSGRSQLVSAELRHRMEEIEAGVWDLRVSKKLSSMNTRNDALRSVSVYVKEALALLGPPFITWAIRLNVPMEVADLEADHIAVVNEVNVGGGSEFEGQMGKGANARNGPELEVQMANGANAGEGCSDLEAQMVNGAKGDGGSELETQIASRANVGGGGSEMEAQLRDEANVGPSGSELEDEVVRVTNVGGRSDMEVQMENGTGVGDKSELEEQMINGTNVGHGFQLEEQTKNGTNVAGHSELEAQMVSRGRANVVDGSQRHAQTTNGAQPVNGANVRDGCTYEGQMVNGANVSNGSELGPILVAVPLKEVRVGSSLPTVSRGLVLNDLVEIDSGFRNREVHRSADDQAPGQVNETGLAIPGRNGELGLSIDHSTKDKENQRSAMPRRKHLAHRRTRGPIRIRDAEDLGTDVSDGKYGSLDTPEVNRAQEALKSSISELQELVTDPLPDALRVSETVRSSLAMRSVSHVNGKDVGAENPSIEKGAEPVQSNNDNVGNLPSRHQNDPQSSGIEKDVPNPPVDPGGTESLQTDAANLRNPSFSNQTNVARPSLAERNSTTRTFEWEESINTSQEGTKKDAGRLHLPSPKRTAVSPLKKHEDTRFSKRRKVKRWSLLEEDTLRTGVQKYGEGSWSLILKSYYDIFKERTQVDLKDKWRNMKG